MTLPNYNTYLFRALRRLGKEIKLIRHKDKIIDGVVILPLRKLYDKRFITFDEYNSGIKYGKDFALSELTHHARPVYDSGVSAAKSKKFREKITQDQIKASQRINDIKALIAQEDQKFANYQKYINLKKGVGRPVVGKRLMEILKAVFEEQKSVYYLKQVYGISSEDGEDKIKEICKIILFFYNKASPEQAT